MEEIIVNESIMQFWEKQNSVGLCELLTFGKGIEQYFDNDRHVDIVTKAIIKICQGYKRNPFTIPATTFVRLISYHDFKSYRGISPTAALGLRLYLLHQHGIDWLNPDKELKIFE